MNQKNVNDKSQSSFPRVHDIKTSQSIAMVPLLFRLVGGASGFLLAKGWGFYPPSKVSNTESKVYSHPYMQAIMIFLGEALTFIIPLLQGNNEKYRKVMFTELHLFIVPAILDGLAQTYSNLGIGGELISVQQMIRLATVIPSFLISNIDSSNCSILARSLARSGKLAGISIVLIATALIVAASVAYTPDIQPDCATTLQSAKYTMVSTLFSASYGAFAPMFYKNIDTHPLKIISTEGTVGVILYVLILPFLYQLHLEQPFDWLQQHRTSYIIFNQLGFLAAVFMATTAGYFCSISTSPQSFVMIDAIRPALVCIVSIMANFEIPNRFYTTIFFMVQILMALGYYLFNSYHDKQLIRDNLKQLDFEEEQEIMEMKTSLVDQKMPNTNLYV